MVVQFKKAYEFIFKLNCEIFNKINQLTRDKKQNDEVKKLTESIKIATEDLK